MSAQDLSFSELVTATAIFVEGPVATWWRSNPVGSFYASELDARRAIVAAAPAESTALGSVVKALGEEDVVHDRAVSYGDTYFANVAESHELESIRVLAAELRALFFQDGVSLVNKSYSEEAGRFETRKAVLTPDVRAKLQLFPHTTEPGGPTDMAQWLETVLQASTARLGALLDRKNALLTKPDVPRATELLNAKRGLIALVHQVFASYRTHPASLGPSDRVNVESLRDAWSSAVREATERANARRQAAKKRRAAPADPSPAV